MFGLVLCVIRISKNNAPNAQFGKPIQGGSQRCTHFYLGYVIRHLELGVTIEILLLISCIAAVV